MTPAAILDHFRSRGLVVLERRYGALVQCPGHDDRRPSLDVKAGDDGRTLLYCRAGCRTDDVVEAAGLRLSDLFADAPRAERSGPTQSPADRIRATALALARRQPWRRHLRWYAAADAIRQAEGVQRQARRGDPDVWARLARAAALTTAAENVLAGEV